ncbi:MAG: helix-turn-helix transcriptional regulator [Spirochaetaceae bacterium]|nr:helix-turn-helix transcriptional regulator [Spirochaetaceae bacterium]
MDLQDIFISNLKLIRKSKNITQEKLAEMCNTDTAYIGQIETKKRFPRINFIEKIAEALDVDAYLLFKNKSEESSKQKHRIDELKSELFNLIDDDIESFLRKHCK